MGKDKASAPPIKIGGAWEWAWSGLGGAPAQSLPNPISLLLQKLLFFYKPTDLLACRSYETGGCLRP